MQNKQTSTTMLTGHRDIKNWVLDRNGIPAIERVRNRFGQEHAQLKLRFANAERARPVGELSGMSPCSWTAWLAELDRQQLALSVKADGFEFVERPRAN